MFANNNMNISVGGTLTVNANKIDEKLSQTTTTRSTLRKNITLTVDPIDHN